MNTTLPQALVVIALAIAPVWGGEVTRRYLTNEDIRQSREIREAHLSPDGTRVLAVITDSTADRGRPHLWLLPASAGTPRQLTFSADDDSKGQDHGVWANDGSTVFYIEDAGPAGRRLFRTPTEGGKPEALIIHRVEGGGYRLQRTRQDSSNDLDVSDYWISPNGQWLALTATERDTPEEKGKKDRGDDAVSVGEETHKPRLFLAGLDTAVVREIPLNSVRSVSWDKASLRLLVVTEATQPDLDPAASLWIDEVAGQAPPLKVESVPASISSAAWVDDKQIVYFAQCEQDTPPSCRDLYAYDLQRRAGRNLTSHLAVTVASEARIVVDPNSHAVVLTVDRDVNQTVVRIAVDGSGVDFVDVGMPFVSQIEANGRQTGWVVLAGGPTAPTSAYLLASLSGKIRKRVSPDLIPSGLRLIASQRLTWKNEGENIGGLLYLPPNVGTAPLPLVVNVHGGVAAQFHDRYYALVNLLIAQGWAVLQPNPRGSTGYGKAFMAAIKDDLGGRDLSDIVAGVKYAESHWPIDAQRVALIGYSFGGEMAAFAAGKTKIFNAVVSGAPVSDQFSEYGTEDLQGVWYDHWYFGNPLARFSAAWRQSPIAFASQATTPVLIVQGLEDTDDPPGQSLELFRALRQAHDPVELVIYPREDHSQLGRNFCGEVSVEPWHGFDLRARMLDFISRGFHGRD